ILREPLQRLQGTYTLQRNALGGMSLLLRFPRSQGPAQCLLVRAGSQYLLVSFAQVLRIEEWRAETTEECYHLCDLLDFPPEPPANAPVRPMLILPPFSVSQK